MSALPRANSWLAALKWYVGLPPLSRVYLKLDDLEARRNDSPRAFACVRKGDRAIRVSKHIEQLPDDFIVGILLHELGHIALRAFGGQRSEVSVDEWVTREYPEAQFTYAPCAYTDADGVPQQAESLERVGETFLKTLKEA